VSSVFDTDAVFSFVDAQSLTPSVRIVAASVLRDSYNERGGASFTAEDLKSPTRRAKRTCLSKPVLSIGIKWIA